MKAYNLSLIHICAQPAYNAHGAMGCVQKSAAWHSAPPLAVQRRFVPPFRF